MMIMTMKNCYYHWFDYFQLQLKSWKKQEWNPKKKEIKNKREGVFDLDLPLNWEPLFVVGELLLSLFWYLDFDIFQAIAEDQI
jgi:hypothetical protein